MTGGSSLRLRADLSLALVALIWGSTFVLVKGALEHVSTMLFLAVRFSIAALALAVALRSQAAHPQAGQMPGWRREIRAGAIVGLCLFSGYVLQTAGLRYTTPAKAGFITGFYIPLVPLLAGIIYRRAPQATELLGVALAATGTALMTLTGMNLKIGAGDLMVLGCSVAFAFHILALDHYTKLVTFEKLSLYQVATGAILGLATFSWIEPARWHFTTGVLLALGITSLFATALAFSVQSWAQQFTTPTRTALILSLEPVFAWMTSFLLAGEMLSGRAVAGAALILAGILLVEVRPAGTAQSA